MLAAFSRCFRYNTVFETGLSDFHLLTVTLFNVDFQKLPLKIVNYRDCKIVANEKFRADIYKFDFGASDLESFKNIIFCICSKQTSIKTKYIQANEVLFMTKGLYKAIIKRSKHKN